MNTPTLTPASPTRNLPIITVVALTILSVALALLGREFGWEGSRYPFLVLSSTGFLIVALLAGAATHWYGRLNFVGLLFCWLGDVLGPYHFALGAGMFLLGHLFFVASFTAYGLDRRKCLWSMALMIPSGVILMWLLPQVDASMRGLVIAYTVVITIMLITSGGTNRLIFIAAVIFYISDIFVARWKFIDHSAINAFYCYPLYYTACLLLAISSLSVGKKSLA